MMIKTLILVNNNFKNDSRVLKQGRSLVQAGYDVTLLCYDYGDLPARENLDGIKVRRLYYPQGRHDRWGVFTRIVKLVCQIRFALAVWLVYGKADIIHCNDLPVLPAGVLAKALRFARKKLVYDAHEYETEMPGLSNTRKAIYKVLERALIYRADAVITVSGSIADEYARLYAIPKPLIVMNCPSYSGIVPQRNIFRKMFSLPDDVMIFLYQGMLAEGRGVEAVLDVFKQASRDMVKDRIVVFMGGGALKNVVKEAAQHHDNIYFHDAVPPDELLPYTASADVGLCFIENSCLSYYYALPNKLFEYVMAGIPVIVSDLYEIRHFVTAHNCGFIVGDNDPAHLRDIVMTMTRVQLQDKAGHIEGLRKTYCWEEQEKILLSVYADLSASLV